MSYANEPLRNLAEQTIMMYDEGFDIAAGEDAVNDLNISDIMEQVDIDMDDEDNCLDDNIMQRSTPLFARSYSTDESNQRQTSNCISPLLSTQ